jgi:cell division protein FtsI (penicillin-binding protein 3)
VVRVSDGHVLAAADWPTFDPNDFSEAPVEFMGARSFSSPYEPGSIMKSVGIAMLIDAGYTYSEDKIVAPGFYQVYPGRFIKNFVVADDRQLTAAGVLHTSSNTGISVLANRMPKAEATRYFGRFGFGEVTGINFLGESSGQVLPVDQVDVVTRYNQFFGQGISVTAAQMASSYQTLANDGVRVPLRLVDGCTTNDGEFIAEPLGEPVRVADVINRMIEMSGRKIEVIHTGLRSGEKLHEVLHSNGDSLEPTAHPLISKAPVTAVKPSELKRLSSEFSS